MFKYVDNKTWKFVDQKSIPNPVHKLYYVDLTEDGVSELITVTAKGLHVYQVESVNFFLLNYEIFSKILFHFQHKLKDVYSIITSRVDKLNFRPDTLDIEGSSAEKETTQEIKL